MIVDRDQIPELNLAGGNQSRGRENQEPLNGPFQVSRSKGRVSALPQEEVAGPSRAVEEKRLAVGRGHDPLLHASQLDIQDLFHVYALQGSEDQYLIDAIHELRRKLPSRRLRGRAINPAVQLIIVFPWAGGESHAAGHDSHHFARTEIGGEENDRAGKIDPPVVAQGQRGLAENAQQKLPKGVAGLLDLVKKDERQFQLVCVVGL